MTLTRETHEPEGQALRPCQQQPRRRRFRSAEGRRAGAAATTELPSSARLNLQRQPTH
jgi:hypothetical protein